MKTAFGRSTYQVAGMCHSTLAQQRTKALHTRSCIFCSQIGAAPGDSVWNGSEIQELSTIVDNTESMIWSSLLRAANDGWRMDDDVVERSTTIYDAQSVGSALHRAVGSGWPTSHQLTGSGGTQSSSSLESLPREDEGAVSGCPRTWADVVRAGSRKV